MSGGALERELAYHESYTPASRSAISPAAQFAPCAPTWCGRAGMETQVGVYEFGSSPALRRRGSNFELVVRAR